MPDAGEALLLRRGHDPAVDDEGRRGVVVQRRNAKDACRAHWKRGCFFHGRTRRVEFFPIIGPRGRYHFSLFGLNLMPADSVAGE
jgi:hypothetical protein